MANDGTEGAARVADVLLLFTDGPSPIGVSAISRRLGLSKAVVHRILRTLVDRRLLDTDPLTRGYQLGPAAAAIGARALRDSELRRVALPFLRGLQVATGETTTLSVPVPEGRVYLAQVESTNEIKMTVELGRRFPLHAGSSSRAILAFLTSKEQAEVIDSELAPLTTGTIVDSAQLRASLDEIRRCGVAQSGGERQSGAGSVAAPVFGFDGVVVGSISVCGPVSRMTPTRCAELAPQVREAADRISAGLGWRGGLPDASQSE
jgi:DNA-binding IclR family transcriptional regulator